MRNGGEGRIEERAARDSGFADDADVVRHAETVLLDGADDAEGGIVAHGEASGEGRPVAAEMGEHAVKDFAAGGIAALHVTVDDFRLDSLKSGIIEEPAVAPVVADAPGFGEDQGQFPVSVPDQAFCGGHARELRLGVDGVDAVAEKVVFQKDDGRFHIQNGGDFLLREMMDRKGEQNDVAVKGIQKFQIILSRIGFEERAGKMKTGIFLQLRFDGGIQILPVFGRPVAVNAGDGPGGFFAVAPDKDSFRRLDGDLSVLLQAREGFFHDSARDAVPPDQLPDRVELFSPVEMVQFRHQCAIKSVDAVLNILGHDRFSCFSGRSPSF